MYLFKKILHDRFVELNGGRVVIFLYNWITQSLNLSVKIDIKVYLFIDFFSFTCVLSFIDSYVE